MLAAVLGLSLALTAPAEPTKPTDPLAVRIAAERHRITHHLPEAPRMPPRTPTVFASLAREHSRHLAARSAYDIQESLLHSAARADDELAFHRERIAELDARIAATTSASYRVQLAQRRTDLQADVARASAELAKHLESLASPGSNSRYREESLYLLVDTLARQDAPSLIDVHRRLAAEFPRS